MSLEYLGQGHLLRPRSYQVVCLRLESSLVIIIAVHNLAVCAVCKIYSMIWLVIIIIIHTFLSRHKIVTSEAVVVVVIVVVVVVVVKRTD